MIKNKRNLPAVRMSDKEKVIVQYITNQLDNAYRNTAGKAVYARNMDQVMKDIFGVKKFTKTLERARYSEPIMISLMKRLDTETLWQICRSKEYYKLLCSLVALDSYIVKQGRKYNKWAEMDPMERPTSKMKKLEKEIRKSKKTYKAVVKTFRDIFDIEKPTSGGGSSIVDSLEDWLDRHDDTDDIFYGLDDFSMDLDSIESMDAYVAKAGRKQRRGRQQAPRVGALGLFDDDGDIFDDEDDSYYGEDDYEDFDREALRSIAQGRPSRRPAPPANDPGYDIAQICQTIGDGFTTLSNQLTTMMDMFADEDEDNYDNIPVSNGAPSPRTARTIGEMMAVTAQENTPAVQVEETYTRRETPVPSTEEVPGPEDNAT